MPKLVRSTVVINSVEGSAKAQGPDLQRILRHTYDSAALTPDLRRA